MKGLGASSRLLELKNAQPIMNLNSGIKKTDITTSIQFENVSFAYAGRKKTLENISFDIPRGKITAVIGPSGSGKSSIANLMLRLYDPADGRVTVDGVDLRDLNATTWRHAIGTVGQEPVLFTCSIRENILMGTEHPEKVSQYELEEAAQLANALDFIQGFENGFETMVCLASHLQMNSNFFIGRRARMQVIWRPKTTNRDRTCTDFKAKNHDS